MANEQSGMEFKNGGDAVLDVLAQYEIEFLFTSPIAALAPLWEAFAKRHRDCPKSLPHYINCRHELLAVSLAIGYYKSTGKLPAVCLPTGLGVLNGSMALRTAKQEQIPMLVISPDTTSFGQIPTADPGPEWPPFLIDEFGPARHAATTTKWSVACRTSEDLYPNLHRAIYFAQQIEKGPVMVEIPFEVMMDRFDTKISPINRFPAIMSDPTVASSKHLDEAAKIIASAENPIIITESFGGSKRATDLLDRFANAIAAPVFEWFIPANANFDRSSPLHGKGNVEDVLEQADVVIALNTKGPWHPPNALLKPDSHVISIDQAPLRPSSTFWGYKTTTCISGDPVANVEQLLHKILHSPHYLKQKSNILQRLARWTAYNRTQQESFESIGQKEMVEAVANSKIHASYFFDQLAEQLPQGSIIVDEMVAQLPYFTHHLFQRREKMFQGHRGWQGGLGTGIGVALGVKLANPHQTVVCVVGDGAFNYNPIPACFGMSQQYGLPIIIVVMNNAGYVSQTWNFYNYFPKGAALSTAYLPGAEIAPTPHYSKIPSAWNGHGIRVETQQDVHQAIESALLLEKTGFVLMDVNVSP